MEVKLVHPDDPEKKVITATDGQQVAAYRNSGFVEEAELKANETAEAGGADAQAALQSKLEATEQKLAETQGALKAAKAALKAAKKDTTSEIEGDN
jgi:hypothetical protein